IISSSSSFSPTDSLCGDRTHPLLGIRPTRSNQALPQYAGRQAGQPYASPSLPPLYLYPSFGLPLPFYLFSSAFLPSGFFSPGGKRSALVAACSSCRLSVSLLPSPLT